MLSSNILKVLLGRDLLLSSGIPRSLKVGITAKVDDIYNHAAIYDQAYKGQRGDKSFYIKHASKGKVLYLGIGSGRIFKKISSINPNAYGLDLSPKMTATLLEKERSKGRIIFANVLEAKIEKSSFETIVAPFCFLNQFSYEDVELILRNCYKWLRPKGRLITDFFSPFKNPPITKNFLKTKKIKNKKMKLESFEAYDFIKQKLLELTFIEFGKKNLLLTLPLHFYYPNEIQRAFMRSGFEVNKIYGDFRRRSLSLKSNSIVLIATKK